MGAVTAGQSQTNLKPLPSKYIQRITTGAPVPEGADAVVMIENTQLIEMAEDDQEEKLVSWKGDIVPGENIREIGVDCTKVDTVGIKGQIIDAAIIGLFGSVGVQEVIIKNPLFLLSLFILKSINIKIFVTTQRLT